MKLYSVESTLKMTFQVIIQFCFEQSVMFAKTGRLKIACLLVLLNFFRSIQRHLTAFFIDTLHDEAQNEVSHRNSSRRDLYPTPTAAETGTSYEQSPLADNSKNNSQPAADENRVNRTTQLLGNARDEDGKLGYRVDPYFIRRNKQQLLRQESSLSFHNGVASKLWFHNDSEKAEICDVPWGNPLTNNVLLRIVLNGEEPQEEPKSATNDTTVLHQTNTSTIIPTPLRSPIDPFKSSGNGPRVLGVVYTYEKHHTLLPAILDTFAWRYDGFFAASSRTKRELGAINLTKIGPESYSNMWQKTRSIVHYVYRHFRDEFDYVHIFGDDVYVIVENLRNLLASYDIGSPGKPLFIGALCPGRKHIPIMAQGGPGYILNMAAIRAFTNTSCLSRVQASAEDRFMSHCLKKQGILLTDSTDRAHRQRMFGYDPDFVASRYGRGYSKGVYDLMAKRHGRKWGVDMVSTNSAVFHRTKSNKSKRKLHAYLYRSCPDDSLLGQVLQRQDAYFQTRLADLESNRTQAK